MILMWRENVRLLPEANNYLASTSPSPLLLNNKKTYQQQNVHIKAAN